MTLNCYFCIPCFSASQKSESQGSKRKLGNQVIRKGWLALHNISMLRGGSRDFWFVLTAENLMWFKDEEVSEAIIRIIL